VKKKFVLEFDEAPAFVYVCHELGKVQEEIYLDGEKFKRWRSLELKTNMDDAPSYTINFIPCK
jgi:hypothetical protein